MKKIKASNTNKYILVDDEDYARTSEYTWRIYKSHDLKRGNYAVRTINWYEGEKRRQKLQYLHHFIIGRKEGMMVDHINQNRLDNRKSNLRYCTQAQNYMNRTGTKSKSGYRGVRWSNKEGKWTASISLNYKKYYLGSFETAEKASKAYQEKAKELYGEFCPQLLTSHNK